MTRMRWSKIVTSHFFLAVVVLNVNVGLTAQGQTEPELVDQFGKMPNDELQGRVMSFENELVKDGSIGLVILKGPELERYFYQRRILGCGIFMKMPTDKLRFKFSDVQEETSIEFWTIPKDFESAEFADVAADYKVNLVKPVEMTIPGDFEEFCPRHFDLDWYAKFLVANPRLSGRAVIKVGTKKEFINRVSRYRKELLGYGVAVNRVRYYHKHFHAEYDADQFWLIPAKKK